MGAEPSNSVNFLELRSYMNYHSVIKRYIRFKKQWRNHYITRYRVVKLRCLLDNIIICLHKYVDLTSKFLIKMHTRKEPPSYRFTSTPLDPHFHILMLWPDQPTSRKTYLNWKIANPLPGISPQPYNWAL